MTTRRRVIIALGAGALHTPLTAFAQQRSPKIARVGWLSYIGGPDSALDLFRDGMRQLGYVEGRSYVIIGGFADGDFTRLPRLAEELASQSLDVLVARGTVPFAKDVRDRVPVVFAYSGDPVEAGFADSLRLPGRNMTGITFMAMELSAKRVEVLKEAIPRAARIALLSNPEHAGELSEYRVTEEAARRLGATTKRYLVRTLQGLGSAFAAIAADNPDAMIVFPDSLTLSRRKEIADFAAHARIPAIYGWTEYAESGGLLSYGPTLTASYRTVAVFVDKVLKGTPASSIPIEQEGKFTLTLNVAAAKALGLNVPQSILVRANMVIE
jgi:putative ABC transport system substrate-binding protein